jgi:RHS repeat-associated protein
MKVSTAFVIAALTLALAPGAFGQSCTLFITGWNASYTLDTSASQTCSGPTGYSGTCTYSQSTSGTPNFTGGGCGWKSLTDSVTSLSFNDTGNWPCPDPPGGTITEAYVGNSGKSASFLTLNTSANTFTFEPEPVANVTLTVSGCSSGSAPGTPAAYPASNWPQTFDLPPTVQPIFAVNSPFDGLDAMFGDNPDIPWTFTYFLGPKYHCKPCKQNGGAGFPWNSSFSTESQSLGEDVPIVGTGFNLHYESERTAGANGDSYAIADAAMLGGWTLSVHHAYDPDSNTLFLGDGNQRSALEMGAPVLYNGNILLTSEDGNEVYVFSLTSGQHTQTLRPLTGVLLYQFAYDAKGNLSSVTDATGNITTIDRNASEQPTAIVSPYAQTTTLAVDSNGFLSQVTDPLGKSQTFVNTSVGLLASRTDANGNTFDYAYDGNGGVSKDADPLGGYVTANRTDATSGFRWTIGETTSMGVTSSYQSTLTLPWSLSSTSTATEQHTDTWPEGLQGTSGTNLSSGQLTDSLTLPDGTSDSATSGPDPVWGLQAPVILSEALTQGNLTMNNTGSRATTLETTGNPFTVTSETNTQAINGNTYTSAFTGSTRTWLNTTPVGRTVTVGLDTLERIASIQQDGLTVTDFTYDSHGRLAMEVQGARKQTFSYNSAGFLSSFSDPLKLKTSFAYDTDGNLITTTLSDADVIAYTYDANGNVTSVTPPGGSAHEFAYNAVDELESYTPPTVSGTGATSYAYDLDRNLTNVTRPDSKTIDYGYDSAGRLISTETPTGTTKYVYNTATGNLSSANRGAQHLDYSYNGPLPTKYTWSGTVAGSVSRTYNDNFFIASESVGGGSDIALGYDKDGLLTKAGTLAVKRSGKDGLITSTTLGVTSDTRSYNGFGELIGYTASVNGTAVYNVTYTRNDDGQVSAKTETINGTINTYSYTYDLAGRLTSAIKNATTDTYTYDSNSNRMSGTTASGTSTGTYDAQDRQLTYGTASFTYTANGELASQTISGKKTSYSYDVLGNLVSATLPNATKLAYIVDGENRRVGKETGSVLEAGFLYDDNDRVVAQLNGSSGLVSQFVYATGSNSPDYMINGGVTYRIFSDQLGSPVLIVNTTTGAIAEQITYDEFGNVLGDTDPGFQPFGLAGGLYDQDLKLVRFGARDYNPAVGRWTVKDPTLFNGGDTNLYAYVSNDPVNLTDPTGLTIFNPDAVQIVTATRGHPCKQQAKSNPKPPKPKPPKLTPPPPVPPRTPPIPMNPLDLLDRFALSGFHF